VGRFLARTDHGIPPKRVLKLTNALQLSIENPLRWDTVVGQDVTQEGRDVAGLVSARGSRAGSSLTVAGAARSARRGLRRAAALTAKGASAVADSISIAHSTVCIGGRRAVTVGEST
jgi:hypothetical protein